MTLRLREGYGRATQARNHPGALSTASPPVLRNSFIHDRFARFSPIAGKNCTVLTTLRQPWSDPGVYRLEKPWSPTTAPQQRWPLFWKTTFQKPESVTNSKKLCSFPRLPEIARVFRRKSVRLGRRAPRIPP